MLGHWGFHFQNLTFNPGCLSATVSGNVIVNTVAGVPAATFQPINKRLASPVIPGTLTVSGLSLVVSLDTLGCMFHQHIFSFSCCQKFCFLQMSCASWGSLPNLSLLLKHQNTLEWFVRKKCLILLKIVYRQVLLKAMYYVINISSL